MRPGQRITCTKTHPLYDSDTVVYTISKGAQGVIAKINRALYPPLHSDYSYWTRMTT